MDKRSDIIDVIVKDNKLILSDQLINMLSAKSGDRINIGYIDKNGNLTPIICIDQAGNKLTSSNTVSFRGNQRNFLCQFGTNFWVTETDGVFELTGDGTPIYTEVKKAVEAYITKEIILDTNYNITKLTEYEF